MPFLWRILSTDGIRPDPEHYRAIKEAPALTNIKQLKSFLGLVTHYSLFLPDWAMLAEPMRAVQPTGNRYDWTSSCQESFDAMKAAIGDHLQLALSILTVKCM